MEKANLLNLTFQKVFRIDDGRSLSLNCSVVPENWIRDIDISSEDVIQAIHLIPGKLSRSPDGIPAFFWKRIFFSILNLLWLLFSLCLSLGTLPIQWKSAIVIPIHKKGSRDHPGNYHPISPVSYVVFWSISLLINYFIIFTVTIFFLLISSAFYLVVFLSHNYLLSLQMVFEI